MEREIPSFFDGLPPDVLDDVLEGLERRWYPSGAVVIAEGDRPDGMYVAQSGAADVFVADRWGEQHLVGRIRPGATLGEMSLFTGQPASGTVRATADLEVLVLREADLERLADRFPGVYRNLGAILSRRLARTNRLALPESPHGVTMLLDWGAPPLLGYALACSVAWHARGSTLLLVLDDAPAEELTRLAGRSGTGRPGAHVILAAPGGAFASAALPETVEDLCGSYAHVLLQLRSGSAASLPSAGIVHLAGPDDEVGAGEGDPADVIRGWVDDGAGRPGRDGVVLVPALSPGDVSALREGLLPPATSAGRALGSAARGVAGLTVGLALGAGSLRGYAHIGVLRALERAGVGVDYLAGTSVGAAVAGLHALGHDAEATAQILDRVSEALFRPTLSRKGLLSNRALRRVLQAIGGGARIEDLPVPVGLVTADIISQEEVVLRRGLLWQAVLASVSIPGVYPAQRIGGRVLVDGGIVNPVPGDVVAGMGAGAVITVRLVGGTTRVETGEAPAADGRPPSALQVIMRSIEMMQRRAPADPTGVTTISIAPEFEDLPGSKLRRFNDGRRYIEIGEAAAEAAMPRIAAALPWLRS